MADARSFTPPTYAERLGVSVNKVLAWIDEGVLRAVNVATKARGRPRWIIPPEAAEAFEAGRSNTTTPVVSRPPTTRRHRQGQAIEFF